MRPGSAGRGSRAAVRGLRVAVTDRLGRPLRVRGLAAWLARVAPASARGLLVLALVSDARIRDLNRRFRRKDAATDVLSFPDDAAPGAPHPAGRLGDIVISVDTARRQAREAGHGYGTELKALALHGLLHLLGYDHHAASDRGRMARLERRLRAKGGLRAGLIERATTSQAAAPAVRARRRSAARRIRAAERARAGDDSGEHR